MRCGTDPGENLERAVARVREAAKAGAQVICLPELFRSQYFCQTEDHANFDLAEPIPGPSTEALARVAKEARVVVIGSLFERRAAGVYHNTAMTDGYEEPVRLQVQVEVRDDTVRVDFAGTSPESRYGITGQARYRKLDELNRVRTKAGEAPLPHIL